MENTKFLKEKYNLHTSSEVEKSAKHTEKRTGEKVHQDSELLNSLSNKSRQDLV